MSGVPIPDMSADSLNEISSEMILENIMSITIFVMEILLSINVIFSIAYYFKTKSKNNNKNIYSANIIFISIEIIFIYFAKVAFNMIGGGQSTIDATEQYEKKYMIYMINRTISILTATAPFIINIIYYLWYFFRNKNKKGGNHEHNRSNS